MVWRDVPGISQLHHWSPLPGPQKRGGGGRPPEVGHWPRGKSVILSDINFSKVPTVINHCCHTQVRSNHVQLCFSQCCRSGSGIRVRCLFDPRIPNPYFWELSDNFWFKSSIILLKIGPNFFLQHFENKIIYNFVKFMATKKVWQPIFFHPSFLLLFLDSGSEMGKNQDPG